MLHHCSILVGWKRRQRLCDHGVDTLGPQAGNDWRWLALRANRDLFGCLEGLVGAGHGGLGPLRACLHREHRVIVAVVMLAKQGRTRLALLLGWVVVARQLPQLVDGKVGGDLLDLRCQLGHVVRSAPLVVLRFLDLRLRQCKGREDDLAPLELLQSRRLVRSVGGFHRLIKLFLENDYNVFVQLTRKSDHLADQNHAHRQLPPQVRRQHQGRLRYLYRR